MATIRTIITGALDRLAVTSSNSVPTNEDIEIGKRTLNSLIDSLSNDILNIFTTTPYRFPLISGKQTYTLGPEFNTDGTPTGADWVVERPMRIENAVLIAYANISGPNNEIITENSSTMFLPLQKANYAQFSDIVVRKLTTTWPTIVYDNGAYPLRKLSYWPVPTQASLATELWLWEPLTTYSTIDDELNLPPGYERYFILKLAVELAPTFSKAVTDSLLANMIDSESKIKTLNQMTSISEPSQQARGLWKGGSSFAKGDSVSNRIPRSY